MEESETDIQITGIMVYVSAIDGAYERDIVITSDDVAIENDRLARSAERKFIILSDIFTSKVIY